MNVHAASAQLATDMDGEDVASFMSAPHASTQSADDGQGYATEALSILHELSKRRQQLSGLTKPILTRASHARKQQVPGAGKGAAVQTQRSASTHQSALRKFPQPHDWTKSAPVELSSYSNPLFDLITHTPPISVTATCASSECAPESPTTNGDAAAAHTPMKAPKANGDDAAAHPPTKAPKTNGDAAGSHPPTKAPTPLDVLKATRLRAHSALHRECSPSVARAAAAAAAAVDRSTHAAVVAELEAAKKREASLAQQLSRARADSVAQKQQLEHQRQLSKELAAAGRTAREALGKMAEQNARLVAAYASTKQQLQALQAAQQAQEQHHSPRLHHLQPHTPNQPAQLQPPQQQPTTPPAQRQQRPLHTTPPQQRGAPKAPFHRRSDVTPPSDQQCPSTYPTPLPHGATAPECCTPPRHQGSEYLHDGSASEDGAASDACTDFSSASTSSTCSDTASSSQDDLQSDGGDPNSGDGSSTHSEAASTGSARNEGLEEAAEGVEEGGRQLREVSRSSNTASEEAGDGRQPERGCSGPGTAEVEEGERQAQELAAHNQQLMQAHLQAERERERQAEEVLQEAECLKQEGNGAFARQQHADAVSCYTRALALQPLPPTFRAIVHCNRAAALHGAGSYVDAIADCFHALHLDPTYTRPLQRRADAFCALGDYSNAVPDLCKACSDHSASKELQQRLWEVQHRARAPPLVNHYAVLQVASASPTPDIKAAYKRLALKYHPDKASSAAEKAAAAVLFRMVSSAHGVLTNADKRKAFDAARLRRKLRKSFSAYHC